MLFTPSHKGGALLYRPTGAHQAKTADPLLYEARKTHQPLRWQLSSIQVSTVAEKGIWDYTNGTRNSLPTGIFLSWYFHTPEPLPVDCTGRRRRQKWFSGMDSCRDGAEGIPTRWTSQPSVLQQFSVNCSCTAKLSHNPSHLRGFYTSQAALNCNPSLTQFQSQWGVLSCPVTKRMLEEEPI